jgi:choline monooxygenase
MVAPVDVAGVCTPPAGAYQDRAQLAAEQDAIFRRSWLVAGLAADVAAPGSYLTAEVVGVPVVISRDGSGQLHALANVCQHRGMIICSGSGSARTFNCPNHAWVYDLDGQLRGAPRATREADFDCATIRLPRYAVHQWGPLVLVNLDPDAAAPTAELGAVDATLAAAGLRPGTMRPFGELAEWTIAANWKIVVENYLECYHCAWVHRDLARVIDVSAEKYALTSSGRLLTARSPVRATGDRAVQQALLATDGPMTDSHWYLLYPSTSINLYPGRGALELTWYLPDGPERTRAYTALFVAPDAPDAYADQVLALLTQVGDEDNTICESMHRGMASGAIARERILPENEALITRFHALLEHDLAGRPT